MGWRAGGSRIADSAAFWRLVASAAVCGSIDSLIYRAMAPNARAAIPDVGKRGAHTHTARPIPGEVRPVVVVSGGFRF